MKRLALITLLTLFGLVSQAQTVTNVDSEQQGDKIKITYSLDRRGDVTAFYSTDNGRKFTPMSHAFGDIGPSVYPGNYKSIIWDVLSDTNALSGEEIVFKVQAKGSSYKQTAQETFEKKGKWFFLFQTGYAGDIITGSGEWSSYMSSTMSIGLMFGKVRKFGWYFQGMYSLTSLGSKELSTGFSTLTFGGMARLGGGFHFYTGAGCGWRKFEYGDSYDSSNSSNYTYENDFSVKQFVADAGLLYQYNHLSLNLGTTFTCSKNTDYAVNFGIGFCF